MSIGIMYARITDVQKNFRSALKRDDALERTPEGCSNRPMARWAGLNKATEKW